MTSLDCLIKAEQSTLDFPIFDPSITYFHNVSSPESVTIVKNRKCNRKKCGHTQ